MWSTQPASRTLVQGRHLHGLLLGDCGGNEGIDCQSWSQIEAQLQQKFPVPQNRTGESVRGQAVLDEVPTNTPIAAMSNHGLPCINRTMPS